MNSFSCVFIWRVATSEFWKIAIGYGYPPWLSFVYILGFVLLGWGVFSRAQKEDIMQSTKEETLSPRADARFDPFIYSLDVFLPIVDLHQESYWHPDVTAPAGKDYLGRPLGYWFRFYFWFHIAMGWIFSTLAVVAFTGVVRKE